MPELHHLDIIARQHAARHWSIPRHVHDDHHELVMVVRGEMETKMEGKATVARPGMIKFHPRDVPHEERALHGTMVELLTICWREAAGYSYADWPRQVEDRTGRIRQLLEWMLELWPARDVETQTTLDAMLQAIVYAYTGTAG